jgi:hypothetical protein
MMASAALIAMMMAHMGPPVVVPDTQLRFTWTQSPTGPGSSLAGPRHEAEGRYWQYPMEVVAGAKIRSHYLQLYQSTGNDATLILNSPSVVSHFILTASSASPFMLEFTQVQRAVDNPCEWGAGLVVRITQ